MMQSISVYNVVDSTLKFLSIKEVYNTPIQCYDTVVKLYSAMDSKSSGVYRNADMST